MKLLGRTPPMGIDCREVGELLQQYLDDHIDAATAHRIEAHLEACQGCGMEAETYERIKSTLAARNIDIPAEAVDRLREFAARLARGADTPNA